MSEFFEIKICGQKVGLDRPFAPPADGYDRFIPLHRHTSDYTFLTPYACNFNLDVSDNNLYDISNALSIGRGGRVNMTQTRVLKDDLSQYNYMCKLIYTWMKKVSFALGRCSSKYKYIQAYAIFFEKTQRGVIHAHGLVFVNNTYISATSQIMEQCWCETANVSRYAQSKLNKTGRHDKAFDGCNNIKSWLKYITKEYNHILKCMYAEELFESSKDKYLENCYKEVLPINL